MSYLICPNCRTVALRDQTVCSHCGTSLIEPVTPEPVQGYTPNTSYNGEIPAQPKSPKNKTYIIISVVASIIMVIYGIIQMTDGLNSLFGGGTQTKEFVAITVPEASREVGSLPELPDEAKFDDFIGEFPEEYYCEVSFDIPSDFDLEISGDLSITLAETNNVTYYKMLNDGALYEIIFESDLIWLREGGKGSFSEVEKEQNEDAIKDMTDGTAEMITGTQLQYSFSRNDFDDYGFTISGYDKVAGRDCVVYEATDGGLLYTYCIDVETKICLKMVAGDYGSYEFKTFKTSGFSIPE